MSARWRVILLVLVFAVILGALLAWWLWPRAAAVDVNRTDAVIEEMRARVEKLTRTLDDLHEDAKQKVVVIREAAKTEVRALSPDGVAAGLNDELARFRSGDCGSVRVDDE